MVEQRLAEQPRRKGLAARTTLLLESQPELLNAGIGKIALCLNLHPRSLQRQLKSEGTHYAELLDEVRFRSAVEGLRAGKNLEDLSERLGFADRRSFTRAFKRWSGLSPSRYQQQTRLGTR